MSDGHSRNKPDDYVLLSRKELSDVALAAAKEAVRQQMGETFGLLGVNLADFNAVKAFRDDIDFAHTVRTDPVFWVNHAYVSKLRSRGSKLAAWFLMALIAALAGGFAISVWDWIKFVFHIHVGTGPQ